MESALVMKDEMLPAANMLPGFFTCAKKKITVSKNRNIEC